MSDSNANISFDDSKNGVTGNAGCNRFFGSYTVRGSSIKFSNIGTTKMFCSKPGVMKDEAAFTRALAAATRYSISRGKLRIYAGKREVLEFEKLLPSVLLMTTVLAQKKWFLDGQTDLKSKDAAFIVFDEKKGSAGGNTGCNVFGGSYKAQGDKLSITDVISTMRACVEDVRMDTERTFLEGLRKTTRFEMRDDQLFLYDEKDKLLLTFTGYDK
jgi:heat shock protein HslJ